MKDNNELCGAKTRSGAPCKKHAMANGRCRLHGGASLSGAKSGTYKHGMYSKAVAKVRRSLAAKMDMMMSDEEVLSLYSDLRLTNARIMEAIENLDGNASPDVLKHIVKKADEADKHAKMGEAAKVSECVSEAFRIAREGLSEYQKWKEIDRLTGQKMNISERIYRRELDANTMVKASEVQVIMDQIVGVVRDAVNDRETILKISQGLKSAFGETVGVT